MDIVKEMKEVRVPSRVSIIKRFFKINHADFVDIIGIFNACLKTEWGQTILTVRLYNGLPHSVTSYQEGMLEYLQEENGKLVFATYTDVYSVPKKAFDQADFVKINIQKKNGSLLSEYASFEFKGFLPRHAICYIQPESVAVSLLPTIIDRNPFGMWFYFGNGQEKNHPITFS
jgi:hypothetical protein